MQPMNLLYLFRQFGDPGLGQSGQVIAAWRFTDSETPVEFEGETYSPMGPVQGSPLSLSAERQSGSGTLTVLKDFPIAQLFLRGYPARPIWLQIINADTAQRSRSSRVRSVKWGEATATLNIEGIGSLLRREGLRIRFQGPCQWALYSTRCGVDRNANLVTGTLDAGPSADGLTLVSSAFATKPDGWFALGDFECAGQSRMVTSHTGNTVTLLAPIDGLTAGDSFEASQGCDRSDGANGCAKFANTLAFGGHVNVPNTNPFEGLER